MELLLLPSDETFNRQSSLSKLRSMKVFQEFPWLHGGFLDPNIEEIVKSVANLEVTF